MKYFLRNHNLVKTFILFFVIQSGFMIYGNICNFYPDNITYYKQLECRSNVDFPGVFVVQINGDVSKQCPGKGANFLCLNEKILFVCSLLYFMQGFNGLENLIQQLCYSKIFNINTFCLQFSRKNYMQHITKSYP